MERRRSSPSVRGVWTTQATAKDTRWPISSRLFSFKAMRECGAGSAAENAAISRTALERLDISLGDDYMIPFPPRDARSQGVDPLFSQDRHDLLRRADRPDRADAARLARETRVALGEGLRARPGPGQAGSWADGDP